MILVLAFLQLCMYLSTVSTILIPYLVTQAASLAILFTALRDVRRARLLLAILFVVAGIFNIYLSIANPVSYLDFGLYAIPLYQDFIQGWFREHIAGTVQIIACLQIALAFGLLFKGWWVTLAAWGAVLFLAAIAPLGAGSAFPSSLTMAVAAFLIAKDHHALPLWRSAGMP